MGQEFGQASLSWVIRLLQRCQLRLLAGFNWRVCWSGEFKVTSLTSLVPVWGWMEGWEQLGLSTTYTWPLQHGVVRVASLMWQFRAPWKSVLRDLSGSYKASSHLVSKSIQCHTSATLCWLQVSQRPAFKERGYTTVWIQGCRVHCMQGSSLVAQFCSGCLMF